MNAPDSNSYRSMLIVTSCLRLLASLRISNWNEKFTLSSDCSDPGTGLGNISYGFEVWSFLLYGILCQVPN
jgi:hypothetical protein